MNYDHVPPDTHRAVLRARLENLEVRHLQVTQQRRDLELAGDTSGGEELDAQLKSIEDEHDQVLADLDAIDT